MFILKWLSDLPPFLLKVLARKSSMCYFLLVAGIGRQWNHSIGEILSGKPTRGIRPRDATAENVCSFVYRSSQLDRNNKMRLVLHNSSSVYYISQLQYV